eukprot:Phypoly_transcript_08579.p1 GENE.Phypoly_transcript_08579~~Phypoly_transcript_08579.p1  ORF type:complete len:289 (-),score=32.81 Phypoly_transcript_08579:76-942(-)
MSFTRVSINGKRFYNIPGARIAYPSVTTILGMIHKPWYHSWQNRIISDHLRTAMKSKPAFGSAEEELSWFETSLTEAGSKPEQIKQDAATLGTQAHTFIDEHLLQGMPHISLVPPHLQSIIQGFEAWRKQSKLVFVRRDAVVYSRTFQYAGAFDALAKRHTDNSLVLIDWKTSNRIVPEYAYQVAAYANALSEMTNSVVDEAWVVRFDKTKPVFEVKKVRSLDQCFQVFLSALHLYRAHERSPWQIEGGIEEDYDLYTNEGTYEMDEKGYWDDFGSVPIDSEMCFVPR